MNETNLRMVIRNNGGPAKVIGIAFDNSAIKKFSQDYPFSEDMINNGFLTFDEIDIHGVPYKVMKPISDVKYVMFMEAEYNYWDYRYLR